jgi:hypothetical protein
MAYSRIRIRELILESFDDEELLTFCQDHFGEAVNQFSSATSKEAKARELIGWCERREKMQDLIDKLKTERPAKYQKYAAELEGKETATSSIVEKIQQAENQVANILKSAEPVEPLPQPAPSESARLESSAHPLGGSLAEIKSWFLTVLSPEEQTFVVTAALFHGLERRELMDVYEEVLGYLKASKAEAAESEARHE